MKNFFIIPTIIFSLSASAGMIKTKTNECSSLFKVDNEIKKGQKGNGIISDKVSYGIIAKDISINFDERVAEFKLVNAVTFGFNRDLTKSSYISGDHPKFNEFIDMYRKDLFTMKTVCLSKKGEILDFTTED